MPELKKLFFGGRIHTVDENLPECDAMIVSGDRIDWLGNAFDLSAVPSDAYEMIDLDGATIVPGFVDSHTHLVFWAVSQTQVDLDGADSYEDALSRVRTFSRKLKNNDRNWIMGRGWKKEQWRRMRLPHKSDLDGIVADRPVMLLSKDEHALWVNTRGLEIAGIDRDTPDPDGGEIVHDRRGEPTGLLYENAAWQVFSKAKPPSLAQMEKALRGGIREMLKLGCVAATTFDSIDSFAALQSFDIKGKLPVKVSHYLPVTFLDEAVTLKLRSGFGSENLKVSGIKIFADGSLGSQTALMLKPYERSSSRGIEVTPAEDLKELLRRCTSAGLACAIHAIGDLANRNVLDAIEVCGRHVSGKFRHRIEHCQIISPRDLSRFAALDVIASMQPTHATADIDLMRLYLGRRQKDAYRFRTLARRGTTICFGSDAPIEPLNPLAGIYAAVTGRRPGGRKCYNPRETVTVSQALRCFTLNGAVAVGEGDIRGSLAPGKKGDFVILDRDVTRCRPDDILNTKVLATYINGKCLHSRDGFITQG